MTSVQLLLLAAASSASAATVDLTEVTREVDDLSNDLRCRETAERLADALQTVLRVEVDGAGPGDRRVALGHLLGACARFLEGWA